MTPSVELPRAAVESARQRADRAESIKRAWDGGQRPDAAAALRANPDIAADRAVALDLAYEEFCAREEAGEALDPETFCARFSFGASLRRLLTVHQFLDEHPDALGGAPPAWPVAGDAVGDFLVFRELGRGSFARVYLAVETTAGDRPVVLKVSAAGSREADTLGPLAHPHLIPLLSCRTVGAWTVVAMPFAGTATLEDALEVVWPADRAEPPRTAVDLVKATGRGGQPDDPPFPARPAPLFHERTGYADAVTAVAAGLFGAVAYLHERGIVHRDIKPSNVLFGPGGRPYLLDFNLASHGADPWRLVGTLPYMAPEQLALFAEPDGRPDGRPGDVFACGVVLFELLTGRHPFGRPEIGAAAQRDTVAAALLAAQRAGHPALGALNPNVRRAVRDAVGRCLALEPAQRPTAAEMVALLARTGDRRRWGRVSALVGAGGLVLVLGYAVSRALVPPGGAAPDPQPAAPAVPDAPFELGSSPPPGPRFRSTAPAVPDTPFELGLYYAENEQYGMAAVAFQKAGHSGQDGRAYGYLAFCLTHERDPKAAIIAADNAVRLGYRTAPVYANRAYNYFQGTNYQQAKDDCDEALALDPDLRPARYTRACAQLQLHFQAQTRHAGARIPPQAVADIDLVTASGSDDPDVWLTAAQIYALTADGRPEMLDRAARAVLTAVRAGKDPDRIRRNRVFVVLTEHPVYKSAIDQPRVAPRPFVSAHLANPIP